jgi:hypothetical protein
LLEKAKVADPASDGKIWQGLGGKHLPPTKNCLEK